MYESSVCPVSRFGGQQGQSSLLTSQDIGHDGTDEAEVLNVLNQPWTLVMAQSSHPMSVLCESLCGCCTANRGHLLLKQTNKQTNFVSCVRTHSVSV